MRDLLKSFGWNEHFEGNLAPGEGLAQVARVVQEHREAYLVHPLGAGLENMWAEISGKLRHTSALRSDFPAVGDWVVLREFDPKTAAAEAGSLQILRILPRRTVLARRLEGKREGGGAGGDAQVLAVNVDLAFLAASLNENFNVRRLERYLALAREARTAGGAPVRPVILLTKADLCADVGPFVEQARMIAGDCEIHAISVVTGAGVELVREYLRPGVTAVVLGSSGIGKSTLVNYLAEADVQDMMQTREFDDKGRHCTTFRNLVRTKAGGLIIDTPGLRGLSLGEAMDGVAATFEDIEKLAGTCRFGNCGHESEPGCAVRGALEAGTLDGGRLEAYLKMQREAGAMAQRENRIQGRKQRKIEKRTTATKEKKGKGDWRGEEEA